MPVELATSPLEVVINDVNDDPSTGEDTAAAQWGKKEAAAGATANADKKSDGKGDAKDWKDKPASDTSEGSAPNAAKPFA